jgi:hypothetical protein
MAAAIFLWLAFFPPPRYRRWIDPQSAELSPLSEEARL